MARAFDPAHGWRFAELSNQRGIDALQLAFRADFTGDRVFAFGVGVGSMIAQAYDDKSQFYLTDSLDAQRLYNAARNLEIAAWKLANARGPNGELLLLSNEIAPGAPNLSFEREFGKLIAYQDTLALVMAQRTNRTIRRFTPGARDGGVPAAMTRQSARCAEVRPRAAGRSRSSSRAAPGARRRRPAEILGGCRACRRPGRRSRGGRRWVPAIPCAIRLATRGNFVASASGRTFGGRLASQSMVEDSRRLTVVVFCRRMAACGGGASDAEASGCRQRFARARGFAEDVVDGRPLAAGKDWTFVSLRVGRMGSRDSTVTVAKQTTCQWRPDRAPTGLRTEGLLPCVGPARGSGVRSDASRTAARGRDGPGGETGRHSGLKIRGRLTASCRFESGPGHQIKDFGNHRQSSERRRRRLRSRTYRTFGWNRVRKAAQQTQYSVAHAQASIR